MIRKVDIPTFLRGLETTQLADGAELPVWPVFQNVRLDQNCAARRKGIVRLDSPSTVHTALDFDGASDYAYAPVNTNIHKAYRVWTLRCLIEPDSVTGTQTLISWDSVSGWPFKLQLSGTDVLLTVKYNDNATATITGGTVAIGTVSAIQAMRRPAASGTEGAEDIELWVDGSEVGTALTDVTKANKNTTGGPMFAADTGTADHFDGTIDHASFLSSYLPDQTYGWMRLPDPKSSDVIFDYWMEESNATTNRMDDRSRHRNHATLVDAPASVTALAVQTMPVNLLAQRIDNHGQSILDVGAGSEIFMVTEPLR